VTPEKAEAVLRAVAVSLQYFVDELEVIEQVRPIPTPAAQHLLASMRQSLVSLEQLIGRDSANKSD
jgi:hypothetical protein